MLKTSRFAMLRLARQIVGTDMSDSQRPECLSAPRKALINVVIVSFIVMSAGWFFFPKMIGMPPGLRQLGFLCAFFGIYQRWAPFAPAVPQANISASAIITFPDGMTRLWEFPRIDRLSLNDRIRQKFWSMVVLNHVLHGRKVWLVDTARYLADSCSTPDNQAQMVSLSAHFGPIPPPERLVSRSNLPNHTSSRTLVVHRLDAKP